MRKRVTRALLPALALFLAYCLGFPCLAQRAARSPVRPALRDKCPVCGMFVAKYPDFLAEILFRDGSYAVFDGAKDMFKFYLDMKRYKPTKDTAMVEAIFVTDYYSLILIDAKEARFVVGSDIYGPMGMELIPHRTEEDARIFMKDHKGSAILRFPDVTADTMKALE